MLRSFDNNYEQLHYTTNTIKKTEKQKQNIFLTQYAFCFNAYSFFVEAGRGRGGGLLERRGLLKNSTSRRGAY